MELLHPPLYMIHGLLLFFDSASHRRNRALTTNLRRGWLCGNTRRYRLEWRRMWILWAWLQSLLGEHASELQEWQYSPQLTHQSRISPRLSSCVKKEMINGQFPCWEQMFPFPSIYKSCKHLQNESIVHELNRTQHKVTVWEFGSSSKPYKWQLDT